MPERPDRPLPRRCVLIVLDSLNRHLLGAYGSDEFDTPNLDRFAARSTRFDRHYVGSLPCIPARHDLLVGALDFLWRPWGSIELWEQPVTRYLARAKVPTMLVTDHAHLFETGGENYHTDFMAWDYQRGHETDPWKTRPDPSWIGAPTQGRLDFPYERSRGYFDDETDFPGPKTMSAAAAWLDESGVHHDEFLLVVDEFDPHEPFDTPEPYASMYDDDWEGPHLIWPPYAKKTLEKGVLTERQAHQVRACYGAKLTMIDHWFGRIVDALDSNGMWDDTVVMVTTDHGHYLGERDMFGKPAAPLFETMAHIPLFVHWPGRGAGAVESLTTSVDIFATIADLFDVEPVHRTHGTSLVPILTGAADSVRDWALAGMWGHETVVLDGSQKYVRAPAGDNAPLSLFSNRWSTMPIPGLPDVGLPPPDGRAYLDTMPDSTIPVIRQPYAAGDMLPYWAGRHFGGNHLYDLTDDPGETRNLAGTKAEKDLVDLLHHALHEVDAPDDQYVRLGL
jgi:arylsulfatase A-like enzyme